MYFLVYWHLLFSKGSEPKGKQNDREDMQEAASQERLLMISDKWLILVRDVLIHHPWIRLSHRNKQIQRRVGCFKGSSVKFCGMKILINSHISKLDSPKIENATLSIIVVSYIELLTFQQEYEAALKYAQGLLRVEPSNRQVLQLEKCIKKRMEKGKKK